MSDNKKPLIIITGPTAVGKTELSIALAKRIGGEIISADSMQVYRHMDIGTAKIMPDEMQGVKHYLIDELEPDEEFNVTIFKQKCDRYIEEIYSHGNIPIIVGGTGFYIQAVLYDIDFTKTETDDAYRKELQKFADEYGNEALHDRLKEIDEKAAEQIHPNNVKRVIRALEYFKQTYNTGMCLCRTNIRRSEALSFSGSKFSEMDREKSKARDYFRFLNNCFLAARDL